MTVLFKTEVHLAVNLRAMLGRSWFGPSWDSRSSDDQRSWKR